MESPTAVELGLPCNLLIEGGAGTGKTTALIERASQAIKSGLRPDRIIVVVPSRPAEKQFRARLIERVGQRASAVLIGPPEDIARLELKACGVSISLAKGGIVTKCTKIAAQSVAGTNWREVRAIITRVKSRKDSLVDLAEGDLELVQRYNSELRKRRFWDAQDVLQLAIDAYEDGRLPSAVYQAVFVDDGQELQPIAHHWLQKHTEAGVPVVVAGCREQTVFGFAGAAGGSGLDAFADRAKAEVTSLTASRRCSKGLLDAAGEITNTTAVPAEGAGHETQFIWCPAESHREEIARIAQAAASDDLTVLARANRYLDQIELGLIGHDISYTRQGGSSVLTHPAFRALIDILKACGDPREESLRQSMDWMQYDNRSWRDLLRTEAINDGAWGLFRDGIPETLPDVHPVIAYVRNLRSWHERAYSQPNAVFQEIAGWLGRRHDGAWMTRLANLPTSLGSGWSSLDEIAGHLEALLLRAMNPEGEETLVTLSTIHASRGQEFDHVWVAGVTEGHCPDPRLPLKDELMLLYVAMTRAKHSLTLSGVGYPESEWLHQKIARHTGAREWLANA